jgi:hypothetical protein
METGNSSQEDQESGAVPVDKPEPDVAPPAPPERDGGDQGARPNKRPIPKWSKVLPVVFEGVVAASALIGLGLLIAQVLYMGETNRLTRESNRLTQEANVRTLRLMEESNRLTREALSESRRQAGESLAAGREQSEANLEVSRRSLADSRRTLEETQRARLVADRCESTEGSTQLRFGPEGGISFMVPSHATVHVRNTGALPATDVRWTIEYSLFQSSAVIVEPGPIPRGANPPRPPEVMRAVIGSGATHPIPVKFRQPGVEYTEMFPYVHGRIDYIDGFDRDRVLRFCWYFDLNEARPTWKPCDHHNWLD